MDEIQKLTALFKEFPGIGERQAKRFVYFVLSKDYDYKERLVSALNAAKESVHQCGECFRFFSGKEDVCFNCKNPQADKTMLLIVERDSDYEAISRSRNYFGKYFVLGGSVPILEKRPEDVVRLRELIKQVENKVAEGLQEIIIACSLTPSGEHTDETVRRILRPIAEKHNLKISSLGRGLSTGTELEYSDNATIKYALESRQ